MKTNMMLLFVLLVHFSLAQSPVQINVAVAKTNLQTKLNKFLNTINNNDIDIGWISFPSVFLGKVLPKKPKDDTLVKRKYYTVTSFIDSLGGIDFLVKKYTKQVVAKQLVGLLNDTTKDFYAHALLCEIFDQKKLGNLYFMERKTEEWVQSMKKDDIKYWHSLVYSK